MKIEHEIRIKIAKQWPERYELARCFVLAMKAELTLPTSTSGPQCYHADRQKRLERAAIDAAYKGKNLAECIQLLEKIPI